MDAGAVLATEVRGGNNGGHAEKPSWTTRERAHHQNGTYEVHWCCQRQESGREGLTGRGEEEQCKRPKLGKLKINSTLQKTRQGE